jgi:hypothetical protein
MKITAGDLHPPGQSPEQLPKLTGSEATTVILGGLTYTLVHFCDGWTLFNSPGNAGLTVVFLLLQYFGPGIIKTFLTLRTGNTWVPDQG